MENSDGEGHCKAEERGDGRSGWLQWLEKGKMAKLVIFVDDNLQ